VHRRIHRMLYRGWRFEWRKGKGWLPKTRECLFYERKRA